MCYSLVSCQLYQQRFGKPMQYSQRTFHYTLHIHEGSGIPSRVQVMVATVKSGLQVMEIMEPACSAPQFKACPVCLQQEIECICMCV